MLKKLPTEYANINSWITSRIFENYLTQLNRHIVVTNKKYCFSLINVPLVEGTQHFSET
jgi:hypothetical protein